MTRLSLKRNMLYNTIGSLTYLVCQWLMTVLAVRLGSYADGGMLSLSISITGFFFAVATFGSRIYQASDTKGRFSPTVYVSTRLATCVAGMLACGAFLLLNGHYTAWQRGCVMLYMTFRLSEAWADVMAAEEQKAWRMDYVGRSLLSRGLLSLASFTAVMAATRSLPLAVAAMAALSLAVAIGYDGRVVRRLTGYRLTFAWRDSLPLLRETWPAMVNCALMTLLAAIPRYMLERYAGSEILGIYTSIATPAVIVQAGCSFIYSPLVAPLSERFAQRDLRGFRRTLWRALAAVAALLLVLIAGAALVGDWGLSRLFGPSILPYAWMLIPALLAAFCSALVYFFEVPLTIARRIKPMMICHLCAAAVSLIASILLIPRMGMMGVNVVLYLSAGGDALAMGLMTARVARG